MSGPNVCQKCWLNWNLCNCQRALNAGEVLLTERVQRLGGNEVYRQEYRLAHGLSVDWQVPCKAVQAVDGKCVGEPKCNVSCRYFVPQ